MNDHNALAEENDRLRHRLDEAEATLEAIRNGEVDALVVGGTRIFTLEGADHPYRVMVEAMQQGVATVNRDGVVLYCNPCFADLLRLPAETIIGGSADRFIAGAAGWGALLTQADASARFETPLCRGDGIQFPASIGLSPLPYRDGYCLLVTDLTQQRQYEDLLRVEKLLRESESRYRAIGEAIDFGVWMCDAAGRNVYASESFLRLVGLSQEECSGPGWTDVLHPDEAAATVAAWAECVRAGGVWDREHRFKGVDGLWHHVLARGVPVHNDREDVIGWVGINLDINRLKNAEQSLRDADHRKDEFLATLAHELRNPLAPVRNAVQVLQMKGQTTPELTWALAVIDRQTRQMTHMIDDLMDVSRISRNKLELRRERIELAQVLQAAVETSQPLIQESGHTLTTAIPGGAIFLDGDATRLAQVFWNLLNNAAKYTAAGGRIHLDVERQGSDVVVSVQDSGIGIPPANLPNIFQMFFQVEGALERAQGGLGIGLALVKRLVELHGGTIHATSAGTGQGSRFSVRLPILIERSADRPATRYAGAAASPTSALRILVVDDNRDSATSLSMILELMGNSTRTAHDGEEAVRAAGEFRPQVVLLDIGLPKLNGYEACRAIRDEPWGRDMLLIAITGWGQDDDRRKSEDAGFDRHLVKPVDPATLMQLLAGLEPAVQKA